MPRAVIKCHMALHWGQLSVFWACVRSLPILIKGHPKIIAQKLHASKKYKCVTRGFVCFQHPSLLDSFCLVDLIPCACCVCFCEWNTQEQRWNLWRCFVSLRRLSLIKNRNCQRTKWNWMCKIYIPHRLAHLKIDAFLLLTNIGAKKYIQKSKGKLLPEI